MGHDEPERLLRAAHREATGLREHRELALAAYAPDTSMKALAAQLSRTEGSLYQLLARIRQELLRCVERTLAREAHLP